jgi:hypothetical protein
MAPIALVMLAFSVAALRGALLPRWLGRLGLAFGLSGAVGTVGVAVAWKPLAVPWFGGLFGWVLWTLLVGVALGLRLRRLTPKPGLRLRAQSG